MLGRNLSHKEINQRLGDGQNYTEAVESFLSSLDASIGRLMRNRSGGRPLRDVIQRAERGTTSAP